MITENKKFKRFVFPNGLELNSLQIENVNFEAVGFVVYAGFRQDPKGKEGLAHLIEHLVSDNCRLSKTKIKEFFRCHGGVFHLGAVNNLATSCSFQMLADERSLQRAFSMFSGMLISSPLKNLDTERRRVSNEIIRDRGSDDYYESSVREDKIVFGWHPYFGKAIYGVGTSETFAAISDNDIKEFYNRYYVPANIAIVACGSLSEECLFNIISQTDFATFKPGVRNPLPEGRLIPKVLKENLFFGRGVKESVAGFCDCYVSAALPGKIIPQAVSIYSQMLDFLLEKKLQRGKMGMYRADSGWLNHVDCHSLCVRVDAIPREKIKEVYKSLDNCFSEINNSQSLFARAKKWSIASFNLNDQNGKELIKEAVAELLLFQSIKTRKEIVDEIKKIEFSDILEIGRWLTPERRWTSFRKV